jgi:hypothetical protein
MICSYGGDLIDALLVGASGSVVRGDRYAMSRKKKVDGSEGRWIYEARINEEINEEI